MISKITKKYIEDYTKRCSNELCSVESKNGKRVISYHEWIYPEHAESACEIEKSEFIKKAHDFFLLHEPDEWVQSLGGVGYFFNKEKFFNDFKKAIENEQD